MLEKAEDIVTLLLKRTNGELSDQEQQVLNEWAANSELRQQLLRTVDDRQELIEEFKNFYLTKKTQEMSDEALLAAFHQSLPPELLPVKPHRITWIKFMAAASLVLMILTASYFLFIRDREMPSYPATVQYKNDVKPGSYKAKLTLADGTVVYLDSTTSGRLASQGNTVVKNEKGQLVYASEKGSDAGKQIYNTLSTARAETYSTVLSDGTKIWLNAESSVRFPVSFTEEERKIELTGEAYLEVAHNPKKPFRVFVRGTTVEVLGTHFVINAYSDEKAIKTSLLEGKIRITTQESMTQVLKPGQQALVDKGGDIQFIPEADVYAEALWKDGIFYFADADLEGVLRQLARWYDVNVKFEGLISTERFHGQIERNIPLSEVLSNMELIAKGVRFSIEDRTIVVATRK